MVAIPTVSTFCGCCDLRVSCVVIASLRLIGSIFLIILSLLLLFDLITFDEEIKDVDTYDNNFNFFEFIVFVFFVLLLAVALINLLFSYWFVRAVTSNNPNRMKYYVVLNAIDAVLYCFFGIYHFKLIYFVYTAIEIYLFICANSLYTMYTSQFGEETMNKGEMPMNGYAQEPEQPPQYGSSGVYDMKDGSVEGYQKQNP